MPSQNLVQRIQSGVDNDALMRSLPQLSRETGIPMPVILRLKREHPEKIPSLGSGSQQFFPLGVVPVLSELLSEQDGGESPLHQRRLLSLARRKREESAPPVPALSIPPLAAGADDGAAQTGGVEVAAAVLAPRFARLEERQLRLSREIAAALDGLSRPESVTFSMI